MNTTEMRKELQKIKGLGDITINRIVDHFEKVNFVKSTQEYCYSFDGERYYGAYQSIEEAIDDAKKDDPDKEAVWVGIARKPELRWNSNEESIIESMIDNLYDDCGEYAEGNLEIPTDQEIELGRMIDKTVEEWIDKYQIHPTCFKVSHAVLYPFNYNAGV